MQLPLMTSWSTSRRRTPCPVLLRPLHERASRKRPCDREENCHARHGDRRRTDQPRVLVSGRDAVLADRVTLPKCALCELLAGRLTEQVSIHGLSLSLSRWRVVRQATRPARRNGANCAPWSGEPNDHARGGVDHSRWPRPQRPCPGRTEQTSWGLASQGLFNPNSGFVRRLEQGRVTDVAFAEPGLQVPLPRVLRIMVLAIEAGDHGGKLAIREDKVALTVMTVDDQAHGLERDVEGHSLHFRGWGERSVPNGRTP
jgi:hypothetical protein